MDRLTLEAAATIVDTALAKGRETGCAPLTVAVLDAGGHLVALKREDGSGIMRADIAFAKAWGALGLGVPSRVLADLAEKMPQNMQTFAVISGGRLFAAPGGVLIRNEEGGIFGAVGVSGDVSDKDEVCAVHGVSEARLVPDTQSRSVY